MELLEQVHGDKSQQAVFGSADGIALIAFGEGFVLLLAWPMAGKHCSSLPPDTLWGTVGIE